MDEVVLTLALLGSIFLLEVVRDPEWDWPTHVTLLTPGGDLVFNVPIEQLVMSVEKEAA